MNERAIIVMGASAGGVETIQKITDNFPLDFPVTILIVIHIRPNVRSHLPEILNRHGSLLAAHAQNGEAIQIGRIYVAPPNHHMEIQEGQIRLSHGPLENGTRPAIDPLFRTAAWNYGPYVIGVLLTGYLDDGAAGLREIKSRGGTTIVQDPAEAFAPSMPLRAIEMAKIDYILPVDKIPAALIDLEKELRKKMDQPE